MGVVRRCKVEKMLKELGFKQVGSYMYEKDGYRVLTQHDPLYYVYTPDNTIIPISLPKNITSTYVVKHIVRLLKTRKKENGKNK